MHHRDYEPFSQNREIFPRKDRETYNHLICGHLNRVKFAPNIKTYLQNRTNHASQIKSLSKARRCFCSDVRFDKSKAYHITSIYNLI